MGISMLKDGAQSRFYRAVGWAKSLALPVRVGNRAQAIFAHAESAEHARLPTLQLRGRFANGESEVLLQRLNAHDPTLVVHVPHGYRIGGIVDPGFPVDAVGLGQHVFGPLPGFRIETSVAAGVHLAGPDLAVLVDLRAVERGVGSRQAVLEDPLLAGIELHQHSAAPAGPVVAL